LVTSMHFGRMSSDQAAAWGGEFGGSNEPCIRWWVVWVQ